MPSKTYTHDQFEALSQDEHEAAYIEAIIALGLAPAELTDAEEDELHDPAHAHWWMLSLRRRERAEVTANNRLAKIRKDKAP